MTIWSDPPAPRPVPFRPVRFREPAIRARADRFERWLTMALIALALHVLLKAIDVALWQAAMVRP